MTFLNNIRNINFGILKLSNITLTETLLFDDSLLGVSTNTLILNSTTGYVIDTKKFDDPIVYKTKNHYLAFEMKIFLFFKISLYFYSTYLTHF